MMLTSKLLGAILAITLLALGHPALAQSRPAAFPVPAGARDLLTPQNSQLMLIDHQPQMGFGVHSHDRTLLINNVAALAETAKAFDVPTVLTTVSAKSFSGPLFPEIQAVFPNQVPIDRTSMNAWDDPRVRQAVARAGRPKLIVAGLWTEVCVVMPVLDALSAGYQVYVVTDASGGVSKEAHDMAVLRMVQAGAIPLTWQQVMLEWQRDWARGATAGAVAEIVSRRSGAYGMGMNYSQSMRGTGEAAAAETKQPR